MEKTKEARVLDMTGGNSFRLLLVFAMPLFMGNLLQQLYNLADTAIAGQQKLWGRKSEKTQTVGMLDDNTVHELCFSYDDFVFAASKSHSCGHAGA